MHLVIPLITEEGDLWIVVRQYNRDEISTRLDRMQAMAQQLDEHQSILWRMPVVVIDREVIPVLDVPHLDKALEQESPILINDRQWKEVVDLIGEHYLWDAFLMIECNRAGNMQAQIAIPRYEYRLEYPVELSALFHNTSR